MDRARLPASGCAHFSPRQACLLQFGRFMGRRAPDRMGSGSGTMMVARGMQPRRSPSSVDRHLRNRCRFAALVWRTMSPNYLGDGLGGGVVFGEACGAGPEACGAGVGGGLTSSSSTSKIRVAFGAMSGPTDRSPYARFDGTNN
jgi:hypothetical protein